MDVNIVAAAGKVAPIERAAAHAADCAEWGKGIHAAGEFARTQVFDFHAGNGFVEFFVFRTQRQRRAVEECAFAAFGVETFAADRIVNHAQFGVAVFNQCDGYGKMRQTVDEVVCAVDRVDNPQAV